MPQAPINPYLPDKGQQLSALLMSLGQGITASDMAGRGVLPGLGLGAGIYGASQAQAQQEAEKAWQWKQQYDQTEAYRKAQEENLTAQADERKRQAALEAQLMPGMQAAIAKLNGGAPGMAPPQAGPTMGPGPDLLKAGAPKVEYLQSKYGLSPVAAAGVVGNLYQESGFNPNATHDGGRGYGMAGWDPNRTAALQAFAQSQGKPASDPQVQLDFVVNEGKSGDMGAQRAWSMLQTAKTPQEATTALMHYFRPAGYTPNTPEAGHGYAQRVQYSQALMPGAAPSGNPQVVPQQMPATVQPPRIDPALGLPFTMSRTMAPFGKALTDLGNAETQRYMQDLDRQQKAEQFRQEQELRLRQQGGTERNQKVGPDGRPNMPLIDAETEAAQRKAKAEADTKLATEAALKLSTDEMARYSKEVRPGIEATVNSLPNLYEMKRLTDGKMADGPFIDTRQFGGRVADWLGISPLSQPLLARNEFINRAARNTIGLLQTRALGSGTGISEGDRKFMESMTQKSGDYTLQELKDLNRIAIETAHVAVKQHDQVVSRLKMLPGVDKVNPNYFSLSAPGFDEWSAANPAANPAPPANRTPLNQILQPNGFASHPNPNAPTNERPALGSILGR